MPSCHPNNGIKARNKSTDHNQGKSPIGLILSSSTTKLLWEGQCPVMPALWHHCPTEVRYSAPLNTIRCCGRFFRNVGFIGRPDDVATIRVRRDKLSTITTECQTLQLLQQVNSYMTLKHTLNENDSLNSRLQSAIQTASTELSNAAKPGS